eukprot:m.254722 g.254722  ORF g.254722 m.254722 type:complete len:142 (-) comp17555_c0_seq17:1458-1883(-)
MMLLSLPDAVLLVILAHAPSSTVVTLGQVCRRLAVLCDVATQRQLSQQGLRMPRRPRGELSDSPYPWRTLLLQYICKSCHGPATFQIVDQRRVLHGRLCTSCIEQPSRALTQMLGKRFLTVETEGVDGRPLFKKKRKRSRR